MNNNEELNKIDITSMLEVFFKTIKKFWLPILAVTIISAIGFCAYTIFAFEPKYESQATFSVNREDNSLISGSAIGDEQIKQSLPYILQSDVMKNMIKEEMGLDYFPAEIALESKESANFFVLRVTADDAGMAYGVLQSALAHIPEASVYVFGKIQVEVLDDSGIATGTSNYMNKKMSLGIGAMLGLVLSMFFVLIYSLTSHTIQKEEDFKKYLSVFCMAVVPKISFKKRRKEIDKHIHIYNDKVGYGFHESMRTLRARIVRMTEKSGHKVLMVTSSIPGEGKSTIAANLALSLAERGRKVVLVDMDLRNPSIADTLGLEIDKQPGLSEFLEKKAEAAKIIVPFKDLGLDIIFAGAEKSDPTKLLGMHRMDKYINVLKSKYEYVILDTPPAAMLADATSIARCADAAIYIVKQDSARIERIAEGLEILAFSSTPIIGAVLNEAEGIFSGYGGYHYGRYGKYGNYGSYGAYGAYGEYAKQGDSNTEYVDVEV